MSALLEASLFEVYIFGLGQHIAGSAAAMILRRS